MTAKIKSRTIAFLLTVILICSCLLIVVPHKALAASASNTNEYIGIQTSVKDLHKATIRTATTDEAPTITVFTHGMSGNFQHWGAIYKDVKGERIFDHLDENSLPMQLKARYNANVYVVNSLNTYVSNESTTENLYCEIEGKKYYTNNETHSGFSVQRVLNDGKLDTNYIDGDERIDFSRHTIILFNEKHFKNLEISLRYKQLHDIIDKLIYEYNDTYNFIPRINLVGHSRGGLLNMMYANEHPYNVDSVYSFGSPYNGSLPSQILDSIKSYVGDSINDLYDQLIGSPVDIYDINNKTNELKNAWNANGTAANVKFKTLTSTFDFDFLLALLMTDEVFDYFKKVQLDKIQDILNQVIIVLQLVNVAEVYFASRFLILSGASLFLPFNLSAMFFGIFGTINASGINTKEMIASLKNVRDNATDVKDCYDGIVRALYNVRDDGPTLINLLCQLVLGENSVSNETLGDIMVQLSSQRANGYNGVTNLCHESYTASVYDGEHGLSYVGKETESDFFSLVSADGQPAIPHNLECRNPHFVNAVLGDINIGQPVCHHKQVYTCINETEHISSCKTCNVTFTQKHKMLAFSAGAIGHYRKCAYCSYCTKTESHAKYYDNIKGRCTVCGYKGNFQITEPFKLKYANLLNMEDVL